MATDTDATQQPSAPREVLDTSIKSVNEGVRELATASARVCCTCMPNIAAPVISITEIHRTPQILLEGAQVTNVKSKEPEINGMLCQLPA